MRQVSIAASIAPPTSKPTIIFFDKCIVVPAGKIRLSTKPNPTNPKKTKRGIKPVCNTEIDIRIFSLRKAICSSDSKSSNPSLLFLVQSRQMIESTLDKRNYYTPSSFLKIYG